MTPLHFATIKGHLNVVEYLVNQKADLHSMNNGVEFLLSMRLLFIWLLDLVVLAFLSIFFIKVQNFNNGVLFGLWNILHWAASYGHLSVAEYPVNLKADKNSKDDNDWNDVESFKDLRG